MTRALRAAVLVLAAFAAAPGCVLSVGIGGKACDPHHDCIDGYFCVDAVCVAKSDLVADGGTARDAGTIVDGGERDAGFVDAGDAGDLGPDAGGCRPAPDGIERCNDFDDDCNGTKDDGCDENSCVDDDTFAGGFISVCTAPVGWQSARVACQLRGLDLAVLEDAKFADIVQADILALNGDGDTWVGASDIDIEGSFAWVDGEPLRFEEFDVGQPNDNNGGQDCLEATSSRWNDENCAITQGFVCAKPPPSPATYHPCAGPPVDNDGDGVDCKSDCDDGDGAVFPGHIEVCGDRKDNDCDGVIDEACAACQDVGVGGALYCQRITTWNEAQRKCADLGMQLGKIETQDLEDALNALLVATTPGRMWIGLNDVAVEGTNVWDDGTPLGAFQPFEAGEPSGTEAQDCFSMRDAAPAGVDGGPAGDGVFGWGDEECTNRRGAYVCTP